MQRSLIRSHKVEQIGFRSSRAQAIQEVLSHPLLIPTTALLSTITFTNHTPHLNKQPNMQTALRRQCPQRPHSGATHSSASRYRPQPFTTSTRLQHVTRAQVSGLVLCMCWPHSPSSAQRHIHYATPNRRQATASAPPSHGAIVKEAQKLVQLAKGDATQVNCCYGCAGTICWLAHALILALATAPAWSHARHCVSPQHSHPIQNTSTTIKQQQQEQLDQQAELVAQLSKAAGTDRVVQELNDGHFRGFTLTASLV